MADLDLDAIRARHEDHMVLWAGPVEAMTAPFTAAGAVTCAAAASAADVPALLAEVERQAAELAFIRRVLTISFRHDMHEDIFCNPTMGWPTTAFFVNCSDLFWWGTADAEGITPDNVDAFEQAITDCEAVDKVIGSCYAGQLFAARQRGMRPQGAAYPKERAFWPLFDACGPERKVGLGNPRYPAAEEAIKHA